MSYDNFAHTFSESRKNHPWPELDYIIKDMKKEGFSSILDIGCGNGRFLEEVHRAELKIRQYLGIDSSIGMIKEARKLHSDNQFEMIDMLSISTIPPSNYPTIQLFDAILFLASFHHLKTAEERISVLKNVRKFLSPTGKIYMTNWNLLDQERYKKSHRGNGDFDIKIGKFSRYYHGFTIEELTGLFQESELEVVENRVFEGGRNFLSILSL